MVRTISLMAALLAICGTAFAAGQDLGHDLSGRACRADPRYTTPPDPALPMPIDVVCGGEQPSGGVQATLLAEPADHAALAQWMATSASTLSVRMTCGKPAVAELAGGTTLVSACTLPGGWPGFRMVVAAGRLVVHGDGVAAALPAVEQAVRHMAGRDNGPLAGTDGPRRVTQATGNELRIAENGMAERAAALLDEARLANGRGDHIGAERAYRTVLELQVQGLGPDDPAIADTLTRLALDVSNQRRFNEARSLFQRAEPLVKRSPDPLAAPQLLQAQALDALNRQQPTEARALARRAGDKFAALAQAGRGRQAAGIGNTSIAGGEHALALMTEAAAALRLGDLASGDVAAASALHEIDHTPGVPSWWKPEAMVLLGEAEGRLGHFDRGEALLTAAIERDTALFGDGPPTANARLALSRLYAASGRYPQALAACAQALGEGSNPLGFEAVAPCFNAAIQTVTHSTEGRDQILDLLFRAVQRVQMGVADTAVAHIAEALAASDPSLAEAVRAVADADRRRSEARLALEVELALPREQRNRKRVAWLTDRLHADSRQWTAADKDLRQRFPDYAQLEATAPAHISEVRGRLADNEGFLAFTFGREFGLAVLVTKSSATAIRIPLGADQVARMALDLRGAMTARAGHPQPFNAALAYRLYAAILQPLEPALADVRHLNVLAAGPLASLPLALLISAPPDRGETAWVARRFSLASWPSAHVFATLRFATRSPAPLPMLGIGDPRGAAPTKGAMDRLSEYCRGDGPVPGHLLESLPPLPDTRTELQRVASALGARAEDVLVGPMASEASLRARPLGQYRVLYFATHALLPAELRCLAQPGLVLSPPAHNVAQASEDGLFEASEVAGAKLNADLVVLSACNTATSAGAFGGEALSSLADAFFFAGARSVLASHWSVPSAATAQLMTSLFGIKGGSVAEALRQAQLTLINNPTTAHPVYWAGFTVIGGTPP